MQLVLSTGHGNVEESSFFLDQIHILLSAQDFHSIRSRKLPIVYGGFMGCIYAITWTNNQYIGYKDAYRDIYYDMQNGTLSDSPDKSYNAILPEGYTISNMGGAQAYQSRLKEWQNSSLRNRDMSILITIAVYALSLVDAYVDAQLFDFDISRTYKKGQNQNSKNYKKIFVFSKEGVFIKEYSNIQELCKNFEKDFKTRQICVKSLAMRLFLSIA